MAKEKFAAHRVVDRVGYGVGVRLQLSASQIADRRHALEVEDKKAGIVTVTEPIEFRAGEEIGITHALTRHEESALEVIKARPSSVPTVPVPSGENVPPTGDSAEDTDTGKDDAGNADAADEDEGAAIDDGENEKAEEGSGNAG